ncbi:glutamate racemase [Vitreimonas sp.]|uniref:glutamate racemase n=1 Tax=Vitreimonas sp. TaxID=3069702 RepID=UPI002D779D40|nr:glutamate racemase [Vitreimonas sp.]
MKRVLVFDSGVGGLSVFDAVAASGHALELDYAADNAWLPYGLKSDAELRARVPALLQRLVDQWAPDAVVVACNTASTIALDAVRERLAIPVVGVVPPIKPAAALTRTGVIGLLATPATVRRAYTSDLIAQFAADKRVVRFGSAALVEAAERKLRGEPFDPAALAEAMEGLFGAPGGAEIDVIALACTHFPLLAPELAQAAPRPVVWLDSGEAIARRVANVLIAAPGNARIGRAGFTDARGARELYLAFRTRGFASFAEIGAAPGFEAAAIVGGVTP